MLTECLLALLLGITIGTFTGLAPGIHINLVSAILLSAIPAFSSMSAIPAIAFVVFITAMAITQTFIDFIPSIFLGAPNEDNFLAILPGHQLLKQGRGYEAIVFAFYGCLTAIILILIISPIFSFLLPSFYNLIKSIIPFILIFISLFLIFKESEFLPALIIFILSGFLGFLTFSLPVKEPLLPLLTGLFGLSNLFISIKDKIQIPEQKIPRLKQIFLSKKEFLKSTLAAAISAPLCSFLPGIGSGQAAVLGSQITETNPKSFLFLVGAINIIVMSLSFVTAFAIQKTRTGASAAVQQLLTKITMSDLIIIIATIIISGISVFFIGLFLAKRISSIINKINYKILSIIILVFLIIINLILSNWLGLLVLLTATALGVFCILSNTRRINLMGCLLIPSILYYLL